LATCGERSGIKVLGATDRLVDDAALLRRYPKLDNSSSLQASECIVECSTKTAKRKSVFPVYFQSTWAAVIVRKKLKKQRSKNRVQRRAACTNISCAKDHWTCPHATSVGTWCSDLCEAIRATNTIGGAIVNPFKEVILPAVTTAPDSSQTAAAQAAEWAAFSDETRRRSSRKLLACIGEVSDCSLFDRLADTGRDAAVPAFLSDVLCEARCFACGRDYNAQGIKSTGATLHKLHGRVAVSLRQWKCSCGELVPYDGAHDSLFSSRKETVFTRTLLYVTTQMVFTGHSTFSSAASVLCRGFGIMIRIKHRSVSSGILLAATSYVHQSFNEEPEHEVSFPAVSSVLLSHSMARRLQRIYPDISGYIPDSAEKPGF